MKNRTGHLYQRGNVFWLQYRIEGRFVQQSLGTTDRKEAEAKQKKIMRPFMAADLASAHAIVESQLRSAETKAQTAAEDAIPPLAMADAWATYERATNRPDSSEIMLRRNKSTLKKFVSWLSKEHPSTTFMRDIDAGTASAYAQRLTADKVTASTFNQHIGFLRLVRIGVNTPTYGPAWRSLDFARDDRLSSVIPSGA